MVTGASTANAALILIDVRHGVIEQTKRHSYLASLLQIPHVIVCINKMDLIDYNEERYLEIISEYQDFAAKLDVQDFNFIPISALHGDNVVNRSNKMPWYEGPTLLYSLENIQVANDINHLDFRFPIQTVIRPHTKEQHDFRGYAGKIASGIIRENDEITALPSGLNATVKNIHGPNGILSEAFAPQSVVIELNENIDISRGDMITKSNNQPNQSQEIDAMVCWMDNKPLNLNNKFIIKHTTRECRAILKEIVYKLDLNSLKRIEDSTNLAMNDIARIKLKTTAPLLFDSYRKNRASGSFILIDETNFNTVAAGMINN